MLLHACWQKYTFVRFATCQLTPAKNYADRKISPFCAPWIPENSPGEKKIYWTTYYVYITPNATNGKQKKNNNNNTIGKNTLHNYCIIVTIYTSTKQHLETWKRLLCDEIISGRRACGNLSAGHETEKKKYIYSYINSKKKKMKYIGEKKNDGLTGKFGRSKIHTRKTRK